MNAESNKTYYFVAFVLFMDTLHDQRPGLSSLSLLNSIPDGDLLV